MTGFLMMIHMKNLLAVLKTFQIFSALAILSNPVNQSMDAFPELCKAYSVAIAIPVNVYD